MVVAGGWSVSKIPEKVRNNLINEACVIGVNDSAIHMPVDYALTMDRLWLEHRIDKMRELGITTYYRRCTAKNVQPEYPQFVPYFGDIWRGQMTLEPGHLWGNNSGRVALNLAYQLAPKRVFMLGFDFKLGPNGEKHWYPPYSWGGGAKVSKMAEWSTEFEYAAHQFEMAQCDLYVVATKGTSIIAPERVPRISIENFVKGEWRDPPRHDRSRNKVNP